MSPLHSPSVQPLANRRILGAEYEGLIALDLEAMLQEFGCEAIGPLSELHDVLSAMRSRPDCARRRGRDVEQRAVDGAQASLECRPELPERAARRDAAGA